MRETPRGNPTPQSGMMFPSLACLTSPVRPFTHLPPATSLELPQGVRLEGMPTHL